MLKFIYILWTLGVLAIFGAIWGDTGKWDSYYSFLLIAWLSFPVGLNCLFLGFTKIRFIPLGILLLTPMGILVYGGYQESIRPDKEPICFLGGKKVDCEEKRMCIKGYDLDTCHEIYEQHREHEIQESIKKDKRIPNDNQRSNH